MTTTYDPHDPAYLDEADVRGELTRAFSICTGCRACAERCPAFPTLFELLDRLREPDPGLLTPAEQDAVVDACFQCGRCVTACPYTPDVHEWRLDVAALMTRAKAMRHANGLLPIKHRVATAAMARPGRVGHGTVGRRLAGAPPGSTARRALAAVTGVSPVRLLPTPARQRFTTWFDGRADSISNPTRTVTVFPTCLVEHHDPAIGRDLVRVYERNGFECRVTTAGCCGAPWLHAGDQARFRRIAERNAAVLASEADGDIVVAQPTCAKVLADDAVRHVGDSSRADAEQVAARVRGVAEHLVLVHRGDGPGLDTSFTGEVAPRVVYHVACHARSGDTEPPGAELVRITGATVELVEQCSGMGGAWGLRAGNEAASSAIADRLGVEIECADGRDATTVVVGECAVANTAMTERTGRVPLHPVRLLARAYGLPAEP